MNLWGWGKKVEKPTEIEPYMAIVRNKSNFPQHIGDVMIAPNETGEVDLSSGGLANAMVEQGILEFVIDIKSIDEAIGFLDRVAASSNNSKCDHKCPICNFECNEDAELLIHMCQEHPSELLALISELTANTANAIGHT